MHSRTGIITVAGVILLLVVDVALSLKLDSYGSGLFQSGIQSKIVHHWPIGNFALDVIRWMVEILGAYHDLILAIATVVIAWFTRTLWVATDGLWKVANKQMADMESSLRIAADAANAAVKSADAAERTVKVIEDTARIQLRGYVAIRRAFFRMFSKTDGEYLKAEVTITNSGHTTANKVRVSIQAQILDVPFIFEFPIRYRPGSTYIAAGGEWNVEEEITLQMSNIIVNNLKAGNKVAVVWGRVEYEDVYGVQHFSAFRLKSALYVQNSAARGWDVYPDGQGNEAT